VRDRTDDRTLTRPGGNNGLAAKLRIVALLDRHITRVHIDVNDFALAHI
jgi:hypothetical protein